RCRRRRGARDGRGGRRFAPETPARPRRRDPAALYGLNDRGVLRPGLKADMNLIDFDRLRLRLPEMAFDLPAGARRLLQRAEGYMATLVSGQVIMREGTPTGAMPGCLIRGGAEIRGTVAASRRGTTRRPTAGTN